jgi:hypothetical protein
MMARDLQHPAPFHYRATDSRMLSMSLNALPALLAVSSTVFAAGPFVNAQLPYHTATLDQQSKLLAWHEPDRNLGWDKVLRLGWDFLERKAPADKRYGTGLKTYLVNSVFDGETLQGDYWQHNPAMVFAGLVDGVVAWYPYSGDTVAIAIVRGMLDHQLVHGTTPPDWDWAGVPFATSCGKTADYGTCIQNMPKEFYGGIETDKVGELGTGYVLFYQLTGERKYLEAALRCATALGRHVRAGDAEHTPWPYRVDARTGVTLAREEFGGNIVGPLRLFDELIRLKEGDIELFGKARVTAVQWLLEHPLNRESPAWNKWTGYFEDVSRSVENVNQMLPTMVAWYVLSNPEPAAVTPKWTRWSMMTGRLLDWVRVRFGRGPYSGAWAIDEQGTPDGHGCCSRAGLGSHTSRWAAVNALYYEKTGDLQAREDAFRALNYASYFALSDGRVSCCGEGFGSPYWFSDGYADYLRHFNWAMGSMPEYAPIGEDHLLRSSSVVQSVIYGSGDLSYRTFAESSTEVIRLRYKPARIAAGGHELKCVDVLSANSYTLTAVQQGDFVVRIRHDGARDVRIQSR